MCPPSIPSNPALHCILQKLLFRCWRVSVSLLPLTFFFALVFSLANTGCHYRMDITSQCDGSVPAHVDLAFWSVPLDVKSSSRCRSGSIRTLHTLGKWMVFAWVAFLVLWKQNETRFREPDPFGYFKAIAIGREQMIVIFWLFAAVDFYVFLCCYCCWCCCVRFRCGQFREEERPRLRCHGSRRVERMPWQAWRIYYVPLEWQRRCVDHP